MAKINLEELELKYFCNGYDVPYKLKDNRILNIKPILVKDYPYYEVAKLILELPKNEVNDIKVIKMSYLEYIEELIKVNNDLASNVITLCKLCFGYENVGFSKNKGKTCLCLCDENEIVEYIITSKDFDEIAKIILNQNDSSYDNRYINPEVKELMESYYKAKAKNFRSPTLEEKKAYTTSKTGIKLNDLNEMTYRYFDLIYNSSVNSEIYITQKMVQCSYKYEVKEDVKHPLFEQKKDPYAEIFEDTTILANKGVSGAEQLNALNLPHDDSVKF